MKCKILGAAVLIGAVVAGCGERGSEKADEMAVSVNGAKLMQSAIDKDVETIVKAEEKNIPAEQLPYARQQIANQLVQSFIFEHVLVAKAKAAGIKVTDADRKEREKEFMEAVSRMPNAPKSLDEYYKKFPLGEKRAHDEFENGILLDKMIKAEIAKQPVKDYSAEANRIIANVVSNNAAMKTKDADLLKKINGLKTQLAAVPGDKLAAKFAELAKANSDCPSAQKGGDLGEFPRGQMVKEFEEAAFKLPVNMVSDPVKSQFGYHLILVTKKLPAVEAKEGKTGSPEKVKASHILLKTGTVQDVPKVEGLVKMLKKQDERTFSMNYITKEIASAKIETSERYKQFLPQTPPPAPKTAAPAPKPEAVVKPAEVKPAVKPAEIKSAVKTAVKQAGAAEAKKAKPPVETPAKK